jgi:hypothetical protein
MSFETHFQIPAELLDPTVQPCPAVTRCCSAWDQAYKTHLAKGESLGTVLRNAKKSYRDAMPPLAGYENIRDFVACVAQGLLLDAISESQSSRLLYAAQVAQGALRHKPGR